MNNDTKDAYLAEFYGPGSHWFAITIGTLSTIVVLSNIFFIILTLTSKSLRSKSSNWFLVGFSISDLLHGVAHVFDAFAIWLGSIDNRQFCALVGIFTVLTAGSSFGFPFLIAADRHYKITIQKPGKISLGHIIFSDRFIIPVIIGWCCITAVGNIALLFFDAFGEDPGGYCGAKKFTQIYMLLLYEIMMVVFFSSLILSAVYYLRLAKWLKQNQHSASGETVHYTKEIMMFTKIITLIPVFLAGPGASLTAFQMVLPEIPMWLKRALTTPYFLSSVANPWLTICLVRPFRLRALKLLEKINVAAVKSPTVRPVRATNTNRPNLSSVTPIGAR